MAPPCSCTCYPWAVTAGGGGYGAGWGQALWEECTCACQDCSQHLERSPRLCAARLLEAVKWGAGPSLSLPGLVLAAQAKGASPGVAGGIWGLRQMGFRALLSSWAGARGEWTPRWVLGMALGAPESSRGWQLGPLHHGNLELAALIREGVGVTTGLPALRNQGLAPQIQSCHFS